MSSRVARRTTTFEESSAGCRRSARAVGILVIVATARPSGVSTTSASPGDGGAASAAASGSSASKARSGSRNEYVRPAGENFTLTNERRSPSLNVHLYIETGLCPEPRLVARGAPSPAPLLAGAPSAPCSTGLGLTPASSL